MQHFSDLRQHGTHAYPTPIVLPTDKMGTTLVLSDVHAPYTNLECFKAAIDDAKAQGVDGVILNGDFVDFHHLSSYEKESEKLSVREELDYANTLLDYLDEQLPEAHVIYKEGNHSVPRLNRYLKRNSPELIGLAGMSLPEMLRMEERGYIFTGSRLTSFGDLVILHGDEIRGIGGIDPARKAALKFPGMNVMAGHTHRGESRFFRRPDGQVNHTHVLGHMGECSPNYHKYTNWRLGWGIIECIDGKTHVDNMIWEDGRMFNVSTMPR